MQIPEDRISSRFEDQGDDDEARQADAELPTELGGGGLAGGTAGKLGL